MLVHEIKPDGQITLVGSRSLGSPGPVFAKGAVTVRLDSGWSNGGNVTITGDVALQCLPGYVWRTARAGARPRVRDARDPRPDARRQRGRPRPHAAEPLLRERLRVA